MKKIILIGLIISSFFCPAQEDWISLDIRKGTNKKTILDVLPIVNNENGYTATFFKTVNGLTSYLHDNKQQLINTTIISKIPKISKVLIGSTISNNQYTLFFSNNNQTRFSALNVNFDTGVSRINENLNINLKKEKKVQFLEINNQLYLLSYIKNTSNFKLHSFLLKGISSNKIYTMSHDEFKKKIPGKHPLDIMLFGSYDNVKIEAINYNVPNALEKTSAYTKVYIKDNKIILTSNITDRHTSIIMLDPTNLESNYRTLENKNYNRVNLGSNSNSYLYNDLFFYVYSTKDKVILSVHNFENNTSIKEYSIEKNHPISFKNSPIIQEGGEFDKYRELDKSSKFIRKLSNANPGISVYKTNNQYSLTLGASIEVPAAMSAAAGGGFIGGMIGAALFSSFNSYHKTKSTRIMCLFDNAFNHLKNTEMPENNFDKINRYANNIESNKIEFQTIFNYKETLIWGYYDKRVKFYQLFKVN